jgi:DNA-binding NarL/FixJ family response regulator
MFKKTLVVEDMDDINKGVCSMLSDLGILEIHQVQYCDDAYLKIKKAIFDNQPYDLIITDLSFKVDHREQKYASGEDLVEALNQEYHNKLPVIVYSVEDRLQRVRRLLNTHMINGYVCKGRNGLKELSKAIHYVNNKKGEYLSPEVILAKNLKIDSDINEYDIQLIKKIAEGYSDKEISAYFFKNNVSPSGLSSIEKRVNKLKDIFRAKNKPHLITLAKDSGFI